MTRLSPTGPEFRSGYVAIVGQPNVGKSTLMNRLVHSRLAIVSPKPQTTRRRILGIVSGEGHQIILLDTPGILDPKYPLQKAMMKTVSSVLSDADVACLLLDGQASSPGRLGIPEEVVHFGGPRVAVVNKIDVVRPKEKMIPILQELGETGLFADIVPLSALTGEGVDGLIPILAGHLPVAPPFYPADQITEQPERLSLIHI